MRGIDAQIKRRMMQDPRRLQQNYKQSRDILDLIALQMIKSEKDQKKKDMMLKMQGNPATIKQQMEQDLVRQTKDDLVKQTSGIMQIQNAQKNRNLQKLLASAGKGRRPPMGGIAQPFNRQKPKTPTMANPLAVGLARAPAPNMQGMTRRAAQGGIVGFHVGGPTHNRFTSHPHPPVFPGVAESGLAGYEPPENLDPDTGQPRYGKMVSVGKRMAEPTSGTKSQIQNVFGPSQVLREGAQPNITFQNKALLDRLAKSGGVDVTRQNVTEYDFEDFERPIYDPKVPMYPKPIPNRIVDTKTPLSGIQNIIPNYSTPTFGMAQPNAGVTGVFNEETIEKKDKKKDDKKPVNLLDVNAAKNLFDEIGTEIDALNAPSYKGTEIQDGQKTIAADLMGTAKGLAETDLDQKQKDAFKTYQEQLGLSTDQRKILEDNITARKTRLSDAEKLFKEAYGNKEQNRMDDLISFLVGAGGTAGIGETLGRGTEASRRNQKARRNARATAVKRLDDLFDKKVTAQESLINKELDIKKLAHTASTTDKEIYGSLTEKGLAIMGSLTAEKMRGLSQDATNLVNLNMAKFKEEGANLRAQLSASSQVRIAQASNVVKVMIANLEGKLDQERIAVEKEIKTLIEQGNQERALSTALNHISRTIASTQAGYTKIYQGIIKDLQTTKQFIPKDKQPEIEALIKFYQDEEQLQISGAVNELKAISDIYLQKLETIGGVSSGFSVTKKSP